MWTGNQVLGFVFAYLWYLQFPILFLMRLRGFGVLTFLLGIVVLLLGFECFCVFDFAARFWVFLIVCLGVC